MANDSLFRAKAPIIVEMLRTDFGLTVDQAAAIVGNLGHESGGFKFLQEIKPLVPNSKGGFGWAQWTGPRRRQFEQWVKDHGLDPHSDEANYGFLKFELETTEKAALPAVRGAANLEDAVRKFELAFERAGVKHYPSRIRYAGIAREEYLRRQTASPDSIPHTPEIVLSFGVRGPQVTALQETLFSLDYAVGKRDGIFGGLTRAAVLAFQADNDLATTGTVDKLTWDMLAKAPPRPLSRDRTTKTAAELAAEGSNTIVQGNRTQTLGWLTGIFGALGIGGGLFQPGGAAQVTAAGAQQAGDATVRQVAERLLQTVGQLNASTPGVAEVRQLAEQIQTAIPTIQGGDMTVDLNAVATWAASLLPGVPSSVLAIGLGVAAHYFGRQVVQSRMQDHHDASNIGR